PAIYTLSLHDALPIWPHADDGELQGLRDLDRLQDLVGGGAAQRGVRVARSSQPKARIRPGVDVARRNPHAQVAQVADEILKAVRSEEHTSELQSPYDL